MAYSFEQELRRMGFSEKEAKVYLSCLELGASPVQRIAQKAGVKRATTYVMIESLMDRGLISTYLQGKKTFFVASSPDRIMNLLEKEKLQAEQKLDALRTILPDLNIFADKAASKPKISFFDGTEGLRAIHEDILKTDDKTLENIVALDDAARAAPSESDVAKFRKDLVDRGIRVRVLYTSKEAKLTVPQEIQKIWEFKKIPAEKFPLHGEITLYGEKVAAFSYRGKIFGTIIESKEIAQTVRVLFELAWMTGN